MSPTSESKPINEEIVSFDPTYAGRHAVRNAEKVEAIRRNMPTVESVLDIGPNQGYLVKALLEAGLARSGSGVELERSVVDPQLLAMSNFQLHVCDIVDFQFEQSFDVVIYNAVHHHVIGKHGLPASWRVWRDIVDHCGRALFFETGVGSESGDYYWKDALLKYYPTDEDYLSSLVRAIGPRLRSVEVLTTLPIHGIERPIYKFELSPMGSESDVRPDSVDFHGKHHRPELSILPVVGSYRRTVGAKGQRLISIEDEAYSDVFSGTEFRRLRADDGKRFFAKKALDPYKGMREFGILTAINDPRVINLVGWCEEYGLVFEDLPWTRLGDLSIPDIENSADFLAELQGFFQWAAQTYVDTHSWDIEPGLVNQRRRLIDLIDMHANNFLVRVDGRSVVEWRFIDLEYYSNRNEARNLGHLASLLGEPSPSQPLSLRPLWRFVRRIGKLRHGRRS